MSSTGTKRPTKRRFNWKRALLFVGVVVFAGILFLGSSVLVMLHGIQSGLDEEPGTGSGPEVALSPEPKPNERINILFLGVDAPQIWNGKALPRRSDTMILVSIDPLTHKVGMLSIPRDTRVHIDAYPPYKMAESDEKINAAHAHGGPKLAMQTVSEFLGVPVHYYVRLDFNGFEKIVDTLGGIDLNVPFDMDYEDPYQDLYIHIKKGPQHMDGHTAIGYVRYREDSDIARIGRQQQFISVMLGKLLSVGTIVKLPTLASQVVQYVDTNIPTDKMLYLATFGTGIKADDVSAETVPGEPQWIREEQGRISYWIADETGLQEATDQMIRGIDKTYNATVRVRILNATTVTGAAQKLADVLESQGFEVVDVANAEEQNNPETTRVINSYQEELPGQITARSVMQLVPTAELFHTPVSAENDTTEPDITVVIGLDFPDNVQTGSR